MSWGEWIRMPDGSVVHVLHSGPRPRTKPCKCGRPSSLLCDYPLGGRKTCDAPLCGDCAVRQGPNIDYCAHHEAPLFKEDPCAPS